MLVRFFVVFYLLFLPFCTYGRSMIDPCQELVVGADLDWVPYSTQQADGHIGGVGVDLIKRIFVELDIPTKVVATTDAKALRRDLRNAKIDLLISTYKGSYAKELVDIIEPGYVSDPITLAIAKKQSNNSVVGWEGLVGLQGVMADAFKIDPDFSEYIKKYLYVEPKATLSMAMSAVAKGEADYIIGSGHQLQYASKKYMNPNRLVILKAIAKPREVYMAMSKKSHCTAYMPYIRQRLREYKTDGSIEDLLDQYLDVKK